MTTVSLSHSEPGGPEAVSDPDMEGSDPPRDAKADLLRAVQYIHPRLQRDIPRPADRPETVAACLTLLRAMANQADLILLAADASLAEDASVNARAMFEAWINMIYLVSQAHDDSGAVRYRAFALLEFLAYLEATSDDGDEAVIRAEIDDLRSHHPSEVRAVEELRSGVVKGASKFYWSGLGPTELVRRAAAHLRDNELLGRFYKFSSWDAHHVLTPVLNVDRERFKSGTLSLGRRQPAEEAAYFQCFIASRMLGQAWTMLADEWPQVFRDGGI